YRKRIYIIPCGKYIFVIGEGVTFIIVGDAISKIKGIGGIGLQRIINLNSDILAGISHRCNLWLIVQRRGNDKLLLYVFYLDVFIKVNANFLAIKIYGIIFRFRFDNFGRIKILWPSFWSTTIGTINKKSAYKY